MSDTTAANQRAAEALHAMRTAAPLVHNITNYVAMNIMANVMLAAGASPAMLHAREEAAEFAGIAQALTLNIGTISPPWAEAMIGAAQAIADKPWVLDPVAVGATGYRRTLGAELLARSPTVIRGNASEILSLAGTQAAGKGADAADSVAAAQDAARALALQTGGVVAVTGALDYVTDGTRAAEVANGHPMMPRITALGCSLTGIVGAFCVGQNPFDATVAALAFYGLAGERAGMASAGPGSFQVAFLDALAAITPEDLAAGARIAAR
ncbi:hydroxyethylthiazole kinase [Salipiger sp. 1_MG-2023]|uniref:hydroxyethylthiazole kinase n=1 Tax=Salipiger sp. 1_MG-2023 TaxID=3062665 RepID=UPI0026E18D03|nr:hydroxyethylthiazole kinase [Salipiger sp. 1_MG-2023]MDO6587987.1 hydroxyethylthiazole kinase [Salipiger sp. 1_MG-2023]